MPEKRSVRFVDSDSAGDVGAVEVDGIVLERGGEPQNLTEDQEKRAREVAPSGVLRAETGASGSKEDK